MPPDDPRKTIQRSLWATAAFLLAFAILITIVSRQFLFPALIAARDASPVEKRQLSAYAMLLMAIVLVIVVIGILLTFRVRRFFLPRRSTTPVQTKYVDAWAESARRMADVPEDSE